MYIADVQCRGFSLIDPKMFKSQGTELRQIWDILGHLYNTERLRIYCGVVRTTLCGRICKGNGVKKTLWERRCEKDVVKKPLWERPCKKVVVKKIFRLTCLFLQIFAIKIVLHRLGALHLWCLCFCMKLMETLLCSFLKVREALTQHFECLRSSHEASVNAIDSDFDRLINMLNRRKKLLKQQLSSQYEDMLSRYLHYYLRNWINSTYIMFLKCFFFSTGTSRKLT